MKVVAKPLVEVLEYKNLQVLNKFRTVYDLSLTEAEEVFMETKKWLWLCALRNESIVQVDGKCPETLVIHHSMAIIDEFWHVFILHTKDYATFCDTFLGQVIHHSPGYADFIPLTEKQTQEQLEYVLNNLGQETLQTIRRFRLWVGIANSKMSTMEQPY